MNTRRLRDAVLAVGIGFGLGSAAIAANDLRDHAPDALLGEVNFFTYCRDTHGQSASAIKRDNDADGWRCMVLEPLFEVTPIDRDDACTEQYEEPAVARSDDPSDPFSWRCYSR